MFDSSPALYGPTKTRSALSGMYVPFRTMWSPFFQPNFFAMLSPATKPLRVAFHSALTCGSIFASSKILSK